MDIKEATKIVESMCPLQEGWCSYNGYCERCRDEVWHEIMNMNTHYSGIAVLDEEPTFPV